MDFIVCTSHLNFYKEGNSQLWRKHYEHWKYFPRCLQTFHFLRPMSSYEVSLHLPRSSDLALLHVNSPFSIPLTRQSVCVSNDWLERTGIHSSWLRYYVNLLTRTWVFYGIWKQEIQLTSGRRETRNWHISSPPQDPVVSNICFFPVICTSCFFTFLFQKHEPNMAGPTLLYKVSHPNSQEKELNWFIWRSILLRM